MFGSVGSRGGVGKNSARSGSAFWRSLRAATSASALRSLIGAIGGSTGSTDKALLRASGTGGATAQASTVTVDDSGNMTVPGTLLVDGGSIPLSSTIVVGLGAGDVGFNVPSRSVMGNIYYDGAWKYAANGRAAVFKFSNASDNEAFLISVAPNNAGGAAAAATPVAAVQLGTAGSARFPNISTTASAANAFLDNTSNNNLLRSTSSLAYKTQVEPIDPKYSRALLDLQPIWYRSLAEADNPAWGWWGFGAEDVAKVDPRLVQWGYRDEDYEDVKVLVAPAVESQPARVDTVKVPIDVVDGEIVYGEAKQFVPPIVGHPDWYETRRQLKQDAVLKPDGVAYDRFVTHLLVLVKDLSDRVAALEAGKA